MSCYFRSMATETRRRRFTTFNTPYERHIVTRADFRIKSIPEIFQKGMKEMIDGLEGTHAIDDNILRWGDSQLSV